MSLPHSAKTDHRMPWRCKPMALIGRKAVGARGPGGAAGRVARIHRAFTRSPGGSTFPCPATRYAPTAATNFVEPQRTVTTLDSRLRGNDIVALDSRLRGNDIVALDSGLRGNDIVALDSGLRGYDVVR